MLGFGRPMKASVWWTLRGPKMLLPQSISMMRTSTSPMCSLKMKKSEHRMSPPCLRWRLTVRTMPGGCYPRTAHHLNCMNSTKTSPCKRAKPSPCPSRAPSLAMMCERMTTSISALKAFWTPNITGQPTALTLWRPMHPIGPVNHQMPRKTFRMRAMASPPWRSMQSAFCAPLSTASCVGTLAMRRWRAFVSPSFPTLPALAVFPKWSSPLVEKTPLWKWKKGRCSHRHALMRLTSQTPLRFP